MPPPAPNTTTNTWAQVAAANKSGFSSHLVTYAERPYLEPSPPSCPRSWPPGDQPFPAIPEPHRTVSAVYAAFAFAFAFAGEAVKTSAEADAKPEPGHDAGEQAATIEWLKPVRGRPRVEHWLDGMMEHYGDCVDPRWLRPREQPVEGVWDGERSGGLGWDIPKR